MLKRCSLYTLPWLLALLFSTGAHATHEKPPGLTVVLLSAYDLGTTRNRFAPFSQLLTRHLGRPVQVRSTSQFQQVETWAQQGQADLVFMGADRGKEMLERHDYRLLAQSFQPVHLYVRRGQLNAPLTRFKHIGVILNTDARAVALNTMPNLSPGVRITDYPHHTSALLALIAGKVDAIVTGPTAVRGVISNIAQRIGARHSFGNVGSATAVISPSLATTPEADLIQQLLLSNEGIVRQVFQDSFGLGAFQPPASSHSKPPALSKGEVLPADSY